MTVAPANSRCVFKSWSGAQNIAETFVSPDKSTSSEVLSRVAQAARPFCFLGGLSHFSSHWQRLLEAARAKMCDTTEIQNICAERRSVESISAAEAHLIFKICSSELWLWLFELASNTRLADMGNHGDELLDWLVTMEESSSLTAQFVETTCEIHLSRIQ